MINMDKRMIMGAILLIAVLLVITAVVVANQFVEGNKVTIKGRVSHDFITGWHVDYNSYEVADESIFSISLWYYPWETKDVQIVVELTDSNGVIYTGETWLGTLNSIMDGRDFEVAIHYLDTGHYEGKIIVYEVDKGFFGVWEESKNEIASTTFEVNI